MARGYLTPKGGINKHALNVSQDGIACEGFSPLQPPDTRKFGTIENERSVSKLSDSEKSEVRSQVSSRYLENLQKNIELGKRIATEDAKQREQAMQHGR